MSARQIDFSYTVFWTKQARQWTPERRTEILAAVQAIVRQPDFLLNAYARHYAVPGLDEQTHAGASLTALEKVLTAFQAE